MKETKEKSRAVMSQKKKVIIVLIILLGALLLCIGMIAIIETAESSEPEYETFPPIDPILLSETKEEDFDIMEYDEYLDLDRNVYIVDKQTGVTQSVSYEDAHLYGEGFELLYEVIIAIIEGDSDTYNYYMGDSSLNKDTFTQQQIYDIKVSMESVSNVDDDKRAYEEYYFKVTYRIHENNGTYRNNIKSDASRPQYFIINNNNSMGELKVVEIIERAYKK